MRPILFEIFGFEIPTYGAILVAAFLISVYGIKHEAKRLDLDPIKMGDAAIAALLFGLLGAKLLLILVDLPKYIQDPGLMVSTLRSAGVIYGGQIGGALGLLWFIRRNKLPLWKTLDLFSPFLALGIGIGRLGCFMAGCCYGVPHEGPLALHFPEHPYCEAPAGIGLFPIQLISLVNGVVLFGILLWVLRNRRFPGQVFGLFFILYGITRGILEFWRGDEIRGMWLGGLLSTSQIVGAVLVVSAAAFYLIRAKRYKKGADPKGKAAA